MKNEQKSAKQEEKANTGTIQTFIMHYCKYAFQKRAEKD